MLKTVYYVLHSPSGKRIKYYTTRAGARIAMRTRNLHLGFKERLSRLAVDAHEYELYTIVEDDIATVVRGTYSIVEDTIEMEELYT
jgi:hypothetical protein